MKNEYDVLIAGSGVAGLYAALNFAPDVLVLVLSKRELTLCNSFLAQGGVAAVVDKTNDDYRLHTALDWLANAYGGQLILFTCHRREAQMLRARQIPFHLLEI